MDPLNKRLSEFVINKVCDYYEVKLANLDKRLNPCRRRKVIYPRQVLEYFLYLYTRLTDEDIAQITGADRCTVNYSAKIISRDIEVCFSISERKKVKDVRQIVGPIVNGVETIIADYNKERQVEELKNSYKSRIEYLQDQLEKVKVQYIQEVMKLDPINEIIECNI